MPTFKSFAAYAAELQRMAVDLTVDEKSDITREMGRAGQKIAHSEAVRSLGGDAAFSGWRRGNPISLDTRLQSGGQGVTTLGPTKRTSGPWTVAQFGRNPGGGGIGATSATRMTGPRLTKTGRVSRARVRRYNGTTQPKRTADHAVKGMERELPKVADKAVRKVISRRFDVT